MSKKEILARLGFAIVGGSIGGWIAHKIKEAIDQKSEEKRKEKVITEAKIQTLFDLEERQHREIDKLKDQMHEIRQKEISEKIDKTLEDPNGQLDFEELSE